MRCRNNCRLCWVEAVMEKTWSWTGFFIYAQWNVAFTILLFLLGFILPGTQCVWESVGACL